MKQTSMKTKLLIVCLFTATTFQCSDELTKSTLSKESLKKEIESRSDFKSFISSAADNQIELTKISSNDKHQIENLSNEILNDYYQHAINKEKVQKFEALTSGLSNEPINAYTSLKGYLFSRFIYSEDDLIESLATGVSSELQKKFSKSTSARMLLLPIPEIDVCGVVCAVKTERSGLEDSKYCYARTIYYSGCYVGCLQ
jgi:hypothetical protein